MVFSVNYDLMLRVQALHHAAWRHKLRWAKTRGKNTKNRDFIPIFQPFKVKLCRLFHLYLVHLDMWILLSDTHGKADDSALPSSIYNIHSPPEVWGSRDVYWCFRLFGCCCGKVLAGGDAASVDRPNVEAKVPRVNECPRAHVHLDKPETNP